MNGLVLGHPMGWPSSASLSAHLGTLLRVEPIENHNKDCSKSILIRSWDRKVRSEQAEPKLNQAGL